MSFAGPVFGNGEFDAQQILAVLAMPIPFGKYKGRKLIELPEPYLVWFHSNGFPEGKIGQGLALAYEIKLNGLEGQIAPLVYQWIRHNG